MPTNLSKQRCRNAIVTHYHFLKSLYLSHTESDAEEVIFGATSKELNTLPKIFYFISNGHIPISQATVNSLKSKEVFRLFFQLFNTVKKINEFNKLHNNEKKRQLIRFKTCIKGLISPIFVQV